MLEIIQIRPEEYRQQIRKLFEENLQQFAPLFEQEFKIRIDVDRLLEQNMATLRPFTPPQGRFWLSQFNTEITGCAGLRQIGEDTAEVKRMYVRTEFRQKGMGRALLEAVIQEAQAIGYRSLRLDHAPFAKSARSLYRSMGFYPIDPYPESEIPASYHAAWCFLEKSLK